MIISNSAVVLVDRVARYMFLAMQATGFFFLLFFFFFFATTDESRGVLRLRSTGAQLCGKLPTILKFVKEHESRGSSKLRSELGKTTRPFFFLLLLLLVYSRADFKRTRQRIQNRPRLDTHPLPLPSLFRATDACPHAALSLPQSQENRALHTPTQS